ncbi:FAD-dependent oxidoreductase [Streptomyces tendae]|uniref:FAD-dependent oxidoreductase n=1 Tax=Streptomyces tendae TaxID=1932 RepID=UPI0036BFF66E
MSHAAPEPSGGRLKVLICGGGVAGQALAYWLARDGHRVTVVERFPALRATGAQVDLRGQGIDTVERTGLLHAVTALACRLHVPDLVARHSKEDRGGDWQLPDVPVSAHRHVP